MKPAIPDVPTQLPPEQQRLLGALKERLEQIGGERKSRIAPLPVDAVLVDVVLKLNELLELLQD